MKSSFVFICFISIYTNLALTKVRPLENLHSPVPAIGIDYTDRLEALNSEASEVLQKAQHNVLSKQINQTYWLYPMYLGSMYSSQYFLLRTWIEKKSKIKLASSRMNLKHYQNLLLQSQNQKDGSWPLIEDINNPQGDLNATIFHYAALKAMGVSSPQLEKAKNFILSKGGIDNSSLFTKIIMSLLGNYSWNRLPKIPYFLFNEKSPINYKDFGQWIGPHLLPISYLKKRETHMPLGPEFELAELFLNSDSYPKTSEDQSIVPPDKGDRKMVEMMLALQKKHGSFGGYTTATLFTIMSLQDYQTHFSDLDQKIDSAIVEGLEFIDELYFDSGDSSYLGVTCDGRYWDTALIAQALLESSVPKELLNNSAEYLLDIQDPKSGGFGFGLDFETYMDTDDTAEILIFLHHMGIKNAQTQKAVSWLLEMQNRDGGWGAFDKNNEGSFLLRFASKDFLDSADMFDESSPDVTGHILEALSLHDIPQKDRHKIQLAINYLKKEASSHIPAWSGRWGSNYIYGTSASLIGLISAGVKPSQLPLITESINWLKSCQNEDGGFGENFQSYTDIKKACKGVSTPTQTAWALMALIKAGEAHSQTAKKAVQYLIRSYNQNNGWSDGKTFVGTGHPAIVPMQYPAYAWAFPMMAVSRYLKFYSLPQINHNKSN